MRDHWEKELACAGICTRCAQPLGSKDRRILSVMDHQPICIACKQAEEKRPEYADLSKQMLAECIGRTGKPYGDAAGYCFHHFCPFTCKDAG